MDIATIQTMFHKEVLEDKIFNHKCLNCHLRNFYTKNDHKCSFCNHKFNINKCTECDNEIINSTLCPLHNRYFYFNVTDIYRYFVNIFTYSIDNKSDETETTISAEHKSSTISMSQKHTGEIICNAKKPNGVPCTKVAKTGTLYCGYHKNYNKQ
jgi:hypothetical protein